MPRSFYIGGTMSLLDDILAHNREDVYKRQVCYDLIGAFHLKED